MEHETCSIELLPHQQQQQLSSAVSYIADLLQSHKLGIAKSMQQANTFSTGNSRLVAHFVACQLWTVGSSL